MPKKRSLNYIETEGGPFILLPLELKKSWRGTGGEAADDDAQSDYRRTEEFGTGVGVLTVGPGQALILGNPEVTTLWPLERGGVFIQRIRGDEDAEVIAVVQKALAEDDWTRQTATFDAGKGKLALFDSACSYDDSDEEERIKVTLPPGSYTIETKRVRQGDIDVELIRLGKI